MDGSPTPVPHVFINAQVVYKAYLKQYVLTGSGLSHVMAGKVMTAWEAQDSGQPGQQAACTLTMVVREPKAEETLKVRAKKPRGERLAQASTGAGLGKREQAGPSGAGPASGYGAAASDAPPRGDAAGGSGSHKRAALAASGTSSQTAAAASSGGGDGLPATQAASMSAVAGQGTGTIVKHHQAKCMERSDFLRLFPHEEPPLEVQLRVRLDGSLLPNVWEDARVTRQYHVTGRGIPQLMPGKMLLGWERLEAGSSEGVGAGSAAGASAAGGDGAAGPSKHVPTLVMALGTVPGKEAAATRKRQAPSSDTHHDVSAGKRLKTGHVQTSQLAPLGMGAKYGAQTPLAEAHAKVAGASAPRPGDAATAASVAAASPSALGPTARGGDGRFSISGVALRSERKCPLGVLLTLLKRSELPDAGSPDVPLKMMLEVDGKLEDQVFDTFLRRRSGGRRDGKDRFCVLPLAPGARGLQFRGWGVNAAAQALVLKAARPTAGGRVMEVQTSRVTHVAAGRLYIREAFLSALFPGYTLPMTVRLAVFIDGQPLCCDAQSADPQPRWQLQLQQQQQQPVMAVVNADFSKGRGYLVETSALEARLRERPLQLLGWRVGSGGSNGSSLMGPGATVPKQEDDAPRDKGCGQSGDGGSTNAAAAEDAVVLTALLCSPGAPGWRRQQRRASTTRTTPGGAAVNGNPEVVVISSDGDDDGIDGHGDDGNDNGDSDDDDNDDVDDDDDDGSGDDSDDEDYVAEGPMRRAASAPSASGAAAATAAPHGAALPTWRQLSMKSRGARLTPGPLAPAAGGVAAARAGVSRRGAGARSGGWALGVYKRGCGLGGPKSQRARVSGLLLGRGQAPWPRQGRPSASTATDNGAATAAASPPSPSLAAAAMGLKATAATASGERRQPQPQPTPAGPSTQSQPPADPGLLRQASASQSQSQSPSPSPSAAPPSDEAGAPCSSPPDDRAPDSPSEWPVADGGDTASDQSLQWGEDTSADLDLAACGPALEALRSLDGPPEGGAWGPDAHLSVALAIRDCAMALRPERPDTEHAARTLVDWALAGDSQQVSTLYSLACCLKEAVAACLGGWGHGQGGIGLGKEAVFGQGESSRKEVAQFVEMVVGLVLSAAGE